MSHPFDTALALDSGDSGDPGTLRGRTHPEWANMVGPYGGITAAVLLHAVQRHPDRQGDPLALTVNYLAPIGDGEFTVTARAVRTNRTNQHWVLELAQDGAPRCTATTVFGSHRDTWSDTEARPPAAPAPETLPTLAGPHFVVWFNNYDARFVEGGMFFESAEPAESTEPGDSSTSTLWLRDSSGRSLDFPALAAACDIFYPRIFRRRGRFVPAGTVSLTTYFHADSAELAAVGADFVLGTAYANRFGAGYFDQSAQLWSRSGILLASSHQMVYFKDDA